MTFNSLFRYDMTENAQNSKHFVRLWSFLWKVFVRIYKIVTIAQRNRRVLSNRDIS